MAKVLSIVDQMVERLRASLRDDIAIEVAKVLGVSSADDDAIGEDMRDATPTRRASDNGHDATYARTLDRMTTRRRKRGPQRASVAYARNYTGRKLSAEMFPTAAKVWSAIVSSPRKPLTNRELETITRLPKKTVESSVWYLRNHDESGRRVKAGTKHALVHSVDAE